MSSRFSYKKHLRSQIGLRLAIFAIFLAFKNVFKAFNVFVSTVVPEYCHCVPCKYECVTENMKYVNRWDATHQLTCKWARFNNYPRSEGSAWFVENLSSNRKAVSQEAKTSWWEEISWSTTEDRLKIEKVFQKSPAVLPFPGCMGWASSCQQDGLSFAHLVINC